MTFRSRILLGVAAVAAFGMVAAILPTVGSAEPREIVVTARDMTFYVAGSTGENPTIHVAPGERVRLTLISEDEGFDHDLSVADWNTEIPLIRGKGRASIIVQAPDRPGTATYICTLHSSMMKGTIEVAAPSSRTQH